jgi:uncharacterized RDD family membrane protein YckC
MSEELEYGGFWIRVGAALIDSLLIAMIILPILSAVYGPSYWGSEAMVKGPIDFLLTWVAPAVATVLFWMYRQATPGKMALGLRVVDATTGRPASTRQLVGRYLGYYVSMIPLMLGLLWVAFDPRKQGWHDKLAHTVVVRRKGGKTEPVRFGEQ